MWRTGLAALQHVGSSRTRAQTRIPCIGRRILNHGATREAQDPTFLTAKRKHYLYLPGLILFPGPLWLFKKYLFGDSDESLQNALKIIGDEHIGICTPNFRLCLKTTKKNDFSFLDLF